MKDPLNRVTTYVYDKLNRVSAVVNGLGNRTTSVYDAAGRVSATVDALSRRVTTLYDANSRVRGLAFGPADRIMGAFLTARPRHPRGLSCTVRPPMNPPGSPAPPRVPPPAAPPAPPTTWQERLDHIVEMMREMSRQTDPQEMVRAYAERIARLRPIDRRLSLSRRGLVAPYYRITRSTTWSDDVNPWKEPQRLPVHSGGLLAELIYADEPRVIDELRTAADDPAAEYLAGHGSLLAIPMYDQGEALNMVVLLQRATHGFPHDEVPDLVWRTNLFGRATSNLVLKDELQQALRALDRELQQVGELQRTLLPRRLPDIPGCNLAAHYQPSKRAGGDYYDFFELPDGQWGFLIADVSGHGTPAAMLMAVTHALVHARAELLAQPARALVHLNEQLTRLYTNQILSFITAFYGVYDPRTRRLRYASAGHNPPRLKHCGVPELTSLTAAHGLPLGVLEQTAYDEVEVQLRSDDLLVLYTDGVTEAQNQRGDLFGLERLDRVLENCRADADELLQGVLSAVEEFAEGRPADDDRTLVLVKFS